MLPRSAGVIVGVYPDRARPTVRGIDPLALVRSLKTGGVATLGALAARTGAPRDELLWAVEEALDHGWISASGPGCGDGICSTSAPTIYAVTERGRSASAG